MKTQITKRKRRLTKAINYIQSTETSNKKKVLDKITTIGIEYYLAKKYQEGELTLREYAELLNFNLWEAIDSLLEFGIKGNTSYENLVESLNSMKKLENKNKRTIP